MTALLQNRPFLIFHDAVGNSEAVKFETELLKTDKDVALQSRGILQMFV